MSTSAASSSGGQRCCMHSALQLLHDWLMARRARAFSHACAFASELCSHRYSIGPGGTAPRHHVAIAARALETHPSRFDIHTAVKKVITKSTSRSSRMIYKRQRPQEDH